MQHDDIELRFVPLVSSTGRNDVLAELILDRPESANALHINLIRGILRACTEINKKKAACRAVVLRGTGKNFCAGADLKWMERAQTLKKAENEKESAALYDVFEAIANLHPPTVAAVKGAAFGGGVGLVAAADWTVAEEGARFSLTEVRRGFSGAVLVSHLCRKMPAGQIQRWVLSGKVASVAEAVEVGLVQKVAPPQGLVAAVREELVAILEGEPEAQRVFKARQRAFLAGKGLSEASWKRAAVKATAESRQNPTSKEGVTAFFEKRKPAWSVEIPQNWGSDWA